MGPLPGGNNSSLGKFFPAYYKTRPLVSKNKIDGDGNLISAETANVDDASTEATVALEKIRLNYAANFLKVFRSIPLAKDPDLYYARLTKVENKKASF